MADPVLSARDVRVWFDAPAGPVEAVRGVSLDLHPGETLAIVGESGAGKSAFAKAILHLHQPPFTPRRSHIDGRLTLGAPFAASLQDAAPEVIRKVRAQAVGMIFQDALSALNPVQRIGPQIAESIRQAAPARDARAVATQVLEILDAIGLPDPPQAARSFPHQLSGGQCQRVMIAIAAVRHPVALIADEPTTALDVTVQAQILRVLKSLQQTTGMAMLFISHDLGVVREIADRVAVMRDGEIVELGPCETLFDAPEHPYTKRLLASRPGRVAAVARPAASADAPLALVENVSFSYRAGLFGAGQSAPVLRDVSLRVGAGEAHGLIGESGSGKSTLGRLVLGFLEPGSGRIETCGVVPHKAAGARRRALRRDVQVIYQDSASALNPRLTLGRSAAEGLEIGGLSRADAQRETRLLFDKVRLPAALMERFPHEVSGGQRQRVCIARALATGPRLLIADEPVTALDMSVQAEILTLFRDLQTELDLAMLFISHDLSVVRALCSHVSVLRRGEMVEDGPTGRVLSQPGSDYTRNLIASIPGRIWS